MTLVDIPAKNNYTEKKLPHPNFREQCYPLENNAKCALIIHIPLIS